MANDVDTRLVLQVSADVKSLERSLRQAGVIANDNAKRIEKSFERTGNVVDQQQKEIQRSLAQTQNASRNLTFQLQDVATSLLSGSSPFQVMAQQASQAATAVDDLRKSGGLLKGIGAAFGSFLNPASLAVSAGILGFGYLVQAAQEYFAEAQKGGEQSAKDLQKQATEIKALADAWKDEATPGLQAYLAELVKLSSEAEKAVRNQETLAKIFEPAKAGVEDLGGEITNIQSLLQTADFDKFGQLSIDLGRAFDEVREKTQANEPALKEIQRLQDLIKQAQLSQIPAVTQLATTIQSKLIPVLQEAARLSGEVRVSSDFSNPITGPSRGPGGPVDMRGANYSIDAQNKEVARKQGEEQARAYLAGLEPEFRSRLEAFIAAASEQGGKIAITSATRSIERQAQLWKAAVQKYGSEDAARKWVAPPGKSMHNVGGAADLSYETEAVKAWAHENAAAYGLVFRLKNEDWHIELARKDAATQTASAERDGANAMREKSSATEAAIGPTQALTQAQKEQAASAKEQADAQQQMAQQLSGIFSSGIKGFAHDLMEGKKAGDAFRDMLRRIAQQLIDMSIDQAFKGLSPLFQGLAGFLTGGFKLAHRGLHSGVSDVRNVSPAVFANAPRFHSGLQPDEFPAILQRGEAVIPRSVVRRGGGNVGNTSISNDIRIDVATGMVTANSQDARDLGRQIDTAVQAVLVRESRPGGLLKQAGR